MTKLNRRRMDAAARDAVGLTRAFTPAIDTLDCLGHVRVVEDKTPRQVSVPTNLETGCVGCETIEHFPALRFDLWEGAWFLCCRHVVVLPASWRTLIPNRQ